MNLWIIMKFEEVCKEKKNNKWKLTIRKKVGLHNVLDKQKKITNQLLKKKKKPPPGFENYFLI